MTKFRIWLELRHGRITAVAEKLGLSKQRIDQISRYRKECREDILNAMQEIEQAEMQDKETCRKIIVKCSDKLNSRIEGVREYAFQELKRWIEFYEHQ